MQPIDDGLDPEAPGPVDTAPLRHPPVEGEPPSEGQPPVESGPPVEGEPQFEGAPLDHIAQPPAPQPPPSSRRRPRLLTALRPQPRTFAVFLRGALVLMMIGFCVAAFVMQLTNKFRTHAAWNLHDFVNSNQLTPHGRTRMLVWLGMGGVVGGVAALLIRVWRPRKGPPIARAVRVLRSARLFWPLMLPCLVWPLLVATDWDPLARVAGIAFVALLGECCVRASAGEVGVGRLAAARFVSRVAARVNVFGRVSPTVVIVALGTVFYAVWMSYGTILQHRQFGTAAFDLGNYDTMFYNLLRGHPFRCPAVLPKGSNWSMLSNHAELTMFALLPLYALRPGAETLLILQAVALAIGAIPLYRFAARRLPRTAAMVLALAYLGYAPTHQANFYDIHFQPFAVVFTLWAIDMLDARRPVLFTIFFVLALGCREDVPIGFAVLGLYLMLVGRHTRAAFLMTITAAVYFVIIKFAVMPRFGNWWFSDLYKDLYPSGENTYGGVVKTLLTNPIFVWKTLVTTEKIVLIGLVLVPLVFLPLRRGLLWMALLPAVPFTVLTTGYGPTVQISFQYVLLYVPFMFLAAALALASYGTTAAGRAKLAGAVGGVAIATFLTMRIWGAMPPGDKLRGGFRDIHSFRPTTPEEKQKARDLAELAAKIPKDAPVAITEMEHPHVSTRLNALGLRVSGVEGVDYVLYSLDGSNAEAAQAAIAAGTFEVVEQRPASRLSLLRRKKP